MDYTLLIDEFLEEVKKGENPQRHYNYIQAFNVIKRFVIEKHKSFEEMNQLELDELFFTRFSGRADSISRNIAYGRNYIKWLRANGHISFQEAESHILFDKRYYTLDYIKTHHLYKAAKLNGYFFSTEEYVDYVEAIFDYKLTRGDNTRFYTDIAVFYLLWLGFTIEAMTSVTKDDFSFETRTIKGKYISDERILNFFNKYNKLETYQKLRKGNNFTTEVYAYNEIEFLKGKAVAVNEFGIHEIFKINRKRVNDFNRANPHTTIENKIDYNNIRKSALFDYIYVSQGRTHLNKTNENIDMLTSIMNDEMTNTRRTVSHIIDDYNLWSEIRGSL